MKPLPGTLFPVEAYDNFTKQIVPRWLDTDDAIIAAYTALVDKVCPCVILFHSQAGAFGFKVAQARPDKVKALVAVEPAVPGDNDKAAAIKNIPVLMMFGDYIPQDSRWPKMRQQASRLRRGGARSRRQRRRDQSPGDRHHRQFAHADDGQEQRGDGRSDPEVAGRQGAGGLIR